MRNRFVCILLFFSQAAYSQLKVMTGTTMDIDSGTVIQLDLHGQVFEVDSAAHVSNNGTIILSDSTDVSEFAGFPVTGTGTETTTRDLSGTITGINIGGLGIAFSNSISGITTITRGHTALMTAPESISRWFYVTSTAGPVAPANPLVLYYDVTELNGNNPAELRPVFRSNIPDNWTAAGGNPDPAQLLTTSVTDSLGWFTAVASALEIQNVNDTSFCLDDSLTVNFSASGYFEPGNEFIFQLSDENGLFAPPMLQDTLDTDTIDFEQYLSATLVPGNAYVFRIVSTAPELTLDSGIVIHGLPFVNINNLLDQYCSSVPSAPIDVIPPGGYFDVGFVDSDSIYPTAATTGMVFFSYTYTDAHGCSATLTDSTEILASPPTPVITIAGDTLFSSSPSGNQWYLNGNPLSGATSQFYVPLSNGIYQVEVTNGSMCTAVSDTLSFHYTSSAGHTTFHHSLQVYPNPSESGVVFIRTLPGNAQVKGELISALGNTVAVFDCSGGNGTHQVDFGHVPAGIYLVRIRMGEIILSKPLIIK